MRGGERGGEAHVGSARGRTCHGGRRRRARGRVVARAGSAPRQQQQQRKRAAQAHEREARERERGSGRTAAAAACRRRRRKGQHGMAGTAARACATGAMANLVTVTTHNGGSKISGCYSFITMKLICHGYLVLSLGICAHKTPTETGLRTIWLIKHFFNHWAATFPKERGTPCLVAHCKIFEMASLHIYSIKYRLITKLIADLVRKSRDESTEPN